ncbi:MAG: ACT domain-containing protein [Planctomycetaceae bacterium]
MPHCFEVLPDDLAICRLNGDAPFPAWAAGRLISLTRSGTELSVVCGASHVPIDVQADRDWSALRICGPLDLDQIGILADISRLLAEAQVAIFVISTYDTDIVLIKQCRLTSAINALRVAGHVVREQ